MENFIPKQKLLELADKADNNISFHKIGLQSYKFHSFLKPEENLELQQIEKVCVQNGLTDGINSLQSGLVIRNMMSDMDYFKESGDDYVFSKKVDNDRKTHIIYGFGCLDGKIPKKISFYGDVRNDLEVHKSPLNGYFYFFNLFVVLHRNDNVDFIFDIPGDYKLYGMTCEELGANVNG